MRGEVESPGQLQLMIRDRDDAEIDRRIAKAQRLCGIPWQLGENCQDVPDHDRQVRQLSARWTCRLRARVRRPVCMYRGDGDKNREHVKRKPPGRRLPKTGRRLFGRRLASRGTSIGLSRTSLGRRRSPSPGSYAMPPNVTWQIRKYRPERGSRALQRAKTSNPSAWRRERHGYKSAGIRWNQRADVRDSSQYADQRMNSSWGFQAAIRCGWTRGILPAASLRARRTMPGFLAPELPRAQASLRRQMCCGIVNGDTTAARRTMK